MGDRSDPEPGLAQLAGYFLRLGTVGFGGPIALTGSEPIVIALAGMAGLALGGAR